MSDIASSQLSPSAPRIEGTEVATNPLLLPQRLDQRLAHFDPNVYDLRPNSVLSRFVKALLGDAGIGQVRKGTLMARLQQTLAGTSFTDLDRFYGALFGMRRRSDEFLAVRPTDAATPDAWSTQLLRDASFRSRIEQFSRAVSFGATPTGMELIAEALLSVDVDLYEGFSYADVSSQSCDDVEAMVVTYTGAEAYTYAELEAATESPFGRWDFTIVPKRPISVEEHYDVVRMIHRFKPVFARAVVSRDGPNILIPLAARHAFSDSEYWEIRSTISAKVEDRALYGASSQDSEIDPVRPPMSAYQGEWWSYNAEVEGVVGYSESQGLVQPGQNRYRLYYNPNRDNDAENLSFIDLTPNMALRHPLAIASGRMGSEGVVAVSPWARPRTKTFGTAQSDTPDSISSGAIPDVYFDGMTAQGVLDGKRARDAGESTRLWVTRDRDLNDTTREIVEVRWATPRLINTYSVMVSHYPHLLSIEALVNDDWTHVHRSKITDSIPKMTQRDRAIPNPVFGEFQAEGHWVKITHQAEVPVTASRIRFVMTRAVNGAGPVSPRGLPIPYPLGIRDIDIGYTVSSNADIPTGEGSFAQSRDLLGSNRSWYVHRESAESLLGAGMWISEPQPRGDAVVNVYFDTRDDEGAGQVIDQVYLDPVYAGAHLSLYHTEDEPSGDFRAVDEAILPAEITVVGSVSPVSGGLSMISDGSYFEVPNLELGWDLTRDWTIYASFVTTSWDSAEVNRRTLLSFGNLYVELGDGGITVGVLTETPVEIPATWSPGEAVNLIITFTVATGALTVMVKGDGQPEVEGDTGILEGTLAADDYAPVTIGSAQTYDSPTDWILRHLMISEGSITDEVMETRFAMDSEVVDHGRFPPRPFEVRTTDNAMLRHRRSWQETANLYGLRGGSGARWDNMRWRPIRRDYVLQRGRIKLPPVRAKYWKFELTNLVAHPYESPVPILREVRTFPRSMSLAATFGDRNPRPAEKLLASPVFRYTDSVLGASSPSFVHYGPGSNTPGVVRSTPSDDISRPTAALYAPASATAAELGNSDMLWRFLPAAQGTLAPRWQEEGRHHYETQVVAHTGKVAFMVGLRSVEFFALDYEATDDTGVYRDHFWSFENITPGFTWELDPNRLYADGVPLPAVAESRVFPSRSLVDAIRFATSQTEPKQIIPDDDFRDPAYASATWTGEGVWHIYGDSSISWMQKTSTVRISRQTLITGEEVAPAESGIDQPLPFPLVGSPYGVGVLETGLYGGIESPLAEVSPAGRIHAAVRFRAVTDLDAPLMLQIVDASDNLLAWKNLDARAGDLVEDYVTWHLDGVVDQVRVRLVQFSPSSGDVWDLDTLSLFDESIVWEFSVDGGGTYLPAYGIRNFVNGVLTFSEPGRNLRWRVTAYRENMNVSSLQIRPRYRSVHHSARASGHLRGPNVSTFDQDPPIAEDPEFSLWWKPVPRSWFMEGKSLLPLAVGDVDPNEFSDFFARSETDFGGVTDETSSRLIEAIREHGEDATIEEEPGTMGTFARAQTEELDEPVEEAYGIPISSDDPVNLVLGSPLGGGEGELPSPPLYPSFSVEPDDETFPDAEL